MKRLIFLTVLITCASISKIDAQANLVLNPSFEQVDTCPWEWNQIQLAMYWSPIDSTGNPYNGYTPTGSPELISGCADSVYSMGNCGEPLSDGFYHYPRTGNNMSQNMMYFDESFENPYRRDYTQGRLSTSLAEGATYCVTFYVALEQESSYAINHIGAYFDDGSIDAGRDTICCPGLGGFAGYLDTNSAQPMTGIIPQILESTILLDTLGWAIWDSAIYEHRWTRVQGSFTAVGGERFITIGNFFDAAHTDTVGIISPPPNWGRGNLSWYLIDDVSVVASNAVADAGPDVAIGRGQSIWIGNDTAAVGGGAGMPCWWYVPGNPVAIDSGGRIQVTPDTTTTYVMMMDLCGHITYDTVTVYVWPLGATSPCPLQREISHVLIAPNPVAALNSTIIVSGDVSGCCYQMMNSIGMVIMQGVLPGNKNEIDVSTLPSGVFILVITDPVSAIKKMTQIVKE